MINCRGCGKPNAEHLFHCSDCYKCETCGTKEGLTTRRDHLECDSCHQLRAIREVTEFDGDTHYTNEITCPWCGHEKMDSWEASDEDTHVCDNCDMDYEHSRDVEVTYCTSKVKPEGSL